MFWVALISVVLGALLLVLAVVPWSGDDVDTIPASDEPGLEDNCLLPRLDEALLKSQRRASFFGATGSFMIGVQFIGGCVIAGGSLQDKLSHEFVSWISVGVVIATAVNTLFNLVASAQGERHSVLNLRVTRNKVEQIIWRIHNEQPEDGDTVDAARETVMSALEEVDKARLHMQTRAVRSMSALAHKKMERLESENA